MSRDAPISGVAEVLRPGLVRVLAPNPSPMTYHGTNTYILGDDSLCIIDPGPDDPAHLAALLQIIAGRPVSHIIVTHSHLDHSALAATLARATKAPVLGFGDSSAGRSAVMQDLARREPAEGGEGVDIGFVPDHTLPDGAKVTGADWQLRVIHTPGHFGNHICLRWNDAIFSGDHVMGWASSMVSPPEGDLSDFMTSCRILRAEAARILYPGHGDPIADPTARIDWLLAHRAARETQILAALGTGPKTIATLTATLYADTPPHLHPAAARNVFAHLIDLVGRNLVDAEAELRSTARFFRR
jgi:glyoxylase-like metal-dependent hydrolase (beta-lactamase superfamily II)